MPQVGKAPEFPLKKTFWQNMKLFDGTYSDENLLALIIAPFAICMNLQYATLSSCKAGSSASIVAIAFVLAQIFGYPPYNLNPQSIGYLSLGPFVGGLMAMLLFSGVTDPIIMFMTRKNKGVYEPEYRLLISSSELRAEQDFSDTAT
jgi:hypothetical protein